MSRINYNDWDVDMSRIYGLFITIPIKLSNGGTKLKIIKHKEYPVYILLKRWSDNEL